MDMESEKFSLSKTFPDIIAFAVGLALAYFLKWETKDLVWSLWLCSLVVGSLTLFSTIGAAFIMLWKIRERFSSRLILAAMGGGVFLLVFFSFHFCGFHSGHSVFLQKFFPLPGVPEDEFGKAFMNPPLLWWLVIKHLLAPYGVFLIPMILSERSHIFGPLMKAASAAPTEEKLPYLISDLNKQKGGFMGRPYINVVRMHLLIFFFGICHALKVESFLIYAVVYFVYFFPWKEAKKLFSAGEVTREN